MIGSVKHWSAESFHSKFKITGGTNPERLIRNAFNEGMKQDAFFLTGPGMVEGLINYENQIAVIFQIRKRSGKVIITRLMPGEFPDYKRKLVKNEVRKIWEKVMENADEYEWKRLPFKWEW